MKILRKTGAIALALALIISMMPLTDGGAHAAGGVVFSGDNVTISGNGSAEDNKTFVKDSTWGGTLCKTDNWTVTYQNTTSSAKAVSISIKVTGDFSSGTLPFFAPVNKPETAIEGFTGNMDTNSAGTELTGVYSFKLKANQSAAIKFRFGYYSGFSGTYNMNLKASVGTSNGVSTDRSKPKAMKAGTVYKGNGDNQTHYYKLTLDSPSAVEFTYTGEAAGTLKVDGTSKEFKNGNIGYFAKGTYVFAVSPSSDMAAEYTLKCGVEKYNLGKLTVTWSGGNNKMNAGSSKKYSFKYTAGTNFGKNNGSRIYKIDGKSKKMTGGTYSSTVKRANAGYSSIPVWVERNGTNTIGEVSGKLSIPVVVKPKKPSTSKVEFSGTNKKLSVNLPCDRANGKKIQLQMYKSGKWKTVKTFTNGNSNSHTANVTGLKGNKSYKFRMCGLVPKSGSKPALKAYSSTFSAKTAPSQTPRIKSLKISNVSVKYEPKVWHPGFWDSSYHWHSGYWSGGYYYTTYTATVKLKSKIKGAKGIRVEGSNFTTCYINGTGTSFKFFARTTGKAKGRTIQLKARSYTKNMHVLGPKSATKKAVIR